MGGKTRRRSGSDVFVTAVRRLMMTQCACDVYMGGIGGGGSDVMGAVWEE